MTDPLGTESMFDGDDPEGAEEVTTVAPPATEDGAPYIERDCQDDEAEDHPAGGDE